MKFTKNQRRFELVRIEDQIGVSGIGLVAEGCQWSDGTVSLRWTSECGSYITYDNIEAVQQVHGHGGKTKVKWLDESPFKSACVNSCKICSASCNDGTIVHGKGCYQISSEGGGAEPCTECP